MKQLSYQSIFRVGLFHLLCLGVFFYEIKSIHLGIFCAFYLIKFWGISAVYHRYLSHRSYELNRFWQFVFILIATISGQGGPLWWASGHRRHHKYSDSDKDIHSPITRSFFISYIGWIFEKDSFKKDFSNIKDFSKFPEIQWLERNNYIGLLLSFIGLYFLGENLGYKGFSFILWGGVLPTILCMHSVCILNSITHKMGVKDFRSNDKSRNNRWLVFLLLGENLHNNHHSFPSSYTNTFLRTDLDPIGFSLRILKSIKIVNSLKSPTPKYIEKQRISKTSRFKGEILTLERDIEEFRDYALKNLKIKYPMEYLRRARIRAFKDSDGYINGGYVIVSEGPLRSISQLDNKFVVHYKDLKLFEINSLWLKPKKKCGFLSCAFWYQVSKDVSSFTNYDYLVFSYEYKKEKLEELYKLSRSKIIYRGPVKPIQGMKSTSYESVQLCDHKKVKLLPLYAFSHFLKRVTSSFSLNDLFSTVWETK